MSSKRAKTRKGMFVYKSYSFVDKDPIIDRVRSAVDMSTMSYKQIRDAGGPSPTTLYGWFNGRTRRPQFCTTIAALRAVGGDFFIKMPDGSTKRHR